MREIFEKYMGHGMPNTREHRMDQRFIYCLVQFDLERPSFEDDFAAVLEASNAADGDASQFVGDVLLVLFGVPIASASVNEEAASFLDAVEDRDLRVLVGEASSGYGTLGYEARMIVTAFNPQIASDVRRLHGLDSSGIHVRWDVAASLTLRTDPTVLS